MHEDSPTSCPDFLMTQLGKDWSALEDDVRTLVRSGNLDYLW
jgi:hypothetical protein